jgi:salicylate hydroxylase
MSKRAIHQGHLYTLQTPEFDQYKEGEPVPVDMLLDAFSAAEKNWSWTVTDPGENRRKAVELLRTGYIKPGL